MSYLHLLFVAHLGEASTIGEVPPITGSRNTSGALGWEDARKARFRTAAQMVEMWRGLDLPAWEAPYVLRDARLGYLNGYERALISGEMSEQQISNAAESRWGERWRGKLRAARERSG